MKKLHVVLLTLCLATAAAAGWARGLPDYYPTSFSRTGNIDRLDISASTIVINDTQYTISANVPVHTLRTQFATVNDLARGMQIAFNATSGAERRPQISEIWVLPRRYRSSSRMDGR